MGNIIYIMGKSASGKDTVYKRIKEKININSYVLYTTRPMRDGEQDGREYNFITKEQFKEMDEKGKVIEARHYNVINANGDKDVWTYATIDDAQLEKNGDMLTIGTLESYNAIKQYVKTHEERKIKLLPVFIHIDEEERRKRAENREKQSKKPNYEEMERRLKADNIDFSEEKLKEAGIDEDRMFENYNLEECVSKIVNYINKNTKEIKKIEDEER